MILCLFSNTQGKFIKCVFMCVGGGMGVGVCLNSFLRQMPMV